VGEHGDLAIDLGAKAADAVTTDDPDGTPRQSPLRAIRTGTELKAPTRPGFGACHLVADCCSASLPGDVPGNHPHPSMDSRITDDRATSART